MTAADGETPVPPKPCEHVPGTIDAESHCRHWHGVDDEGVDALPEGPCCWCGSDDEDSFACPGPPTPVPPNDERRAVSIGHMMTLAFIAQFPDEPKYQEQWSGRLQGMAMAGLVWRFPDKPWQPTSYGRTLLPEIPAHADEHMVADAVLALYHERDQTCGPCVEGDHDGCFAVTYAHPDGPGCDCLDRFHHDDTESPAPSAVPVPPEPDEARETFERQMAAVDANERAAFRAASEGHRIGSRWLTQTILHDPEQPEVMGNCWQTCIASIFGLPLDQVPHFVQDHATYDEVEAATRAWANERGFDMLDVHAGTLDGTHVVAMLHGRSPRGVAHVIVRTADGETHDPHPSRAGLSSVSGAFVFVPIDPAVASPAPSVDEPRATVATPGEWDDTAGAFAAGPPAPVERPDTADPCTHGPMCQWCKPTGPAAAPGEPERLGGLLTAADGTEPGSTADLLVTLRALIPDATEATYAVLAVDAWLDRCDALLAAGSAAPVEQERREYGRQFPDGEVIPTPSGYVDDPRWLTCAGQPVRWVERTVSYSTWTPLAAVPDSTEAPDRSAGA